MELSLSLVEGETSVSRDITGCHIKRSLLGMNYFLWAVVLGGTIDSQTYRLLLSYVPILQNSTPRSHCKTHNIHWAIEGGETNWSVPGRFIPGRFIVVEGTLQAPRWERLLSVFILLWHLWAGIMMALPRHNYLCNNGRITRGVINPFLIGFQANSTRLPVHYIIIWTRNLQLDRS